MEDFDALNGFSLFHLKSIRVMNLQTTKFAKCKVLLEEIQEYGQHLEQFVQVHQG